MRYLMREECAVSVAGTVLLAWSRFDVLRRKMEASQGDDWNEGWHAGRAHAYAEIIRHLTGRQPDTFETLGDVENFLGTKV